MIGYGTRKQDAVCQMQQFKKEKTILPVQGQTRSGKLRWREWKETPDSQIGGMRVYQLHKESEGWSRKPQTNKTAPLGATKSQKGMTNKYHNKYWFALVFISVQADMALGRGHRYSRLLWKIITFIWLIVTLSEVKSTLKVRGVSTDHCNFTKTKIWLNLPHRFGLRFIEKKRSKGYFGSRLTRYPNLTSTFQVERLTESGDSNPNPGPEKCSFCNRAITVTTAVYAVHLAHSWCISNVPMYALINLPS